MSLPDANANNNTMVVIPKQDARIINKIKKSKEFKTVLNDASFEAQKKLRSNDNVLDIGFDRKNGVDSLDLELTIGNAHLYNTHFDDQGNLYTTLIDWYDFDKFPETGFKNGINNNAYEQQVCGDLTNYVLIVPIALSKEEIEEL